VDVEYAIPFGDFTDTLHLNDEGNEKLAGHIAERVERILEGTTPQGGATCIWRMIEEESPVEGHGIQSLPLWGCIFFDASHGRIEPKREYKE